MIKIISRKLKQENNVTGVFCWHKILKLLENCLTFVLKLNICGVESFVKLI